MPTSPQDIIKRIRKIEIKTRNLVQEIFSGEYHSLFKGQGLEFSEVREYQEGDSYRDIDWNVSARFGHPYIKKFRESRELNVLFIVDLSASNQFGTSGLLKADFIAEITAVLSFSALSNQDKVGLILFTDRIEKYLNPRKGRKYTLQILREILYHEPIGKKTDLSSALSFANCILKKRSIIFIVSDFFASEFQKPLQILSQKHDVIALQIIDPAERELPTSGFVNLFDPETNQYAILNLSNSNVRLSYKKFIEVEQELLVKTLTQYRIDHLKLQTDKPYYQELQRFFELRMKRR